MNTTTNKIAKKIVGLIEECVPVSKRVLGLNSLILDHRDIRENFFITHGRICAQATTTRNSELTFFLQFFLLPFLLIFVVSFYVSF